MSKKKTARQVRQWSRRFFDLLGTVILGNFLFQDLLLFIKFCFVCRGRLICTIGVTFLPATLLPPSKPVVTRTSDTSVCLNWTVVQNGSLPVVFFKVQFKEIISGGKKKNRWETLDEEIPPLSRSYEVLSLKSGSIMVFTCLDHEP